MPWAGYAYSFLLLFIEPFQFSVYITLINRVNFTIIFGVKTENRELWLNFIQDHVFSSILWLRICLDAFLYVRNMFSSFDSSFWKHVVNFTLIHGKFYPNNQGKIYPGFQGNNAKPTLMLLFHPGLYFSSSLWWKIVLHALFYVPDMFIRFDSFNSKLGVNFTSFQCKCYPNKQCTFYPDFWGKNVKSRMKTLFHPKSYFFFNCMIKNLSLRIVVCTEYVLSFRH